jgi:hypothetical protein
VIFFRVPVCAVGLYRGLDFILAVCSVVDFSRNVGLQLLMLFVLSL